jgi:hypothetical protein
MIYMGDLLRANFALQAKENNFLLSGQYKIELLRYIVNHYETVEQWIPWFKGFLAEVRERIIDSDLDKKERTNQILDNCSMETLFQLTGAQKALPYAFSEEIEKEYQEWKETFVPNDLDKTRKEWQKSGFRENDKINYGIEVSRNIKYVSNLKWVKTSGCFERAIEAGGLMGEISQIIPIELKKDLIKSPPLEVSKWQSQIFKKIWSECLRWMEPYVHKDCPYNFEGVNYIDSVTKKVVSNSFNNMCQYDHPWLAHMAVLFRGFKVRHLTLGMAPIQYLSSVVQKYMTKWIKNTTNAAESFVPSPKWLRYLGEAARRFKEHGKTPIFHSGDLVGCTNNFIPETSIALADSIIEEFGDQVDLVEFKKVIRLAFSRFKICRRNGYLEDYRKNPIGDIDSSKLEYFQQKIGQHMSNPLSFPVMGAMHCYTTNLICGNTAEHKFRFIRQLQRRLFLNPDKDIFLIIGIRDDGSYHHDGKLRPNPNNPDAERLFRDSAKFSERDYRKMLAIYCAETKRVGIKTVNYFNVPKFMMASNPDWGFLWHRQEREYDQYEYKFGQPEEMRRLDERKYKAWKGDVNPGHLHILQFQYYEPQERTQVLADSMIEKTSGKTNSKARGMFFCRNEDGYVFKIIREAYYYSVGDDHAGVTSDIQKVQLYKAEIMNRFNMKYSQKADFTSRRGVLIAERIGIWSDRLNKLETPIWVKNKMLVEEHGTANLAWIDKALAMRSHMKMEYTEAPKLAVYYWIEKAEDILYRLNKKSIDGFIKKGIDPRLPTALGGYGLVLHKEAANLPFSKITKYHLRILSHWVVYNPSIGFSYLKKLKKCTSRYRTTIEKPYKSRWIRDHKGDVEVSREWVKEILLGSTGYVASFDQRINNEKKTAPEIFSETKDLVMLHYNIIRRDIYGDQDSPDLYSRFDTDRDRVLPRVPKTSQVRKKESDKAYKRQLPIENLLQLRRDPRKIGISPKAYQDLLKMEQIQKDLYKKISLARGNLVEEVSELKAEPVSTLDLKLSTELSPHECISHADKLFQESNYDFVQDLYTKVYAEKKGLYKQSLIERLRADNEFRDEYVKDIEQTMLIYKSLNRGDILGELRDPNWINKLI